MKYIRTKEKIITDDIATHELLEDICDAGYLKVLKKGSLCRIGETWFNYYGRWTSIKDIDGCTYDIRPNEVEKVTKELKSADTIEELCDEFVVIGYEKTLRPQIIYGQNIKKFCQNNKHACDIYGAIWTEWGLKYVAKMNDEGVLELL